MITIFLNLVLATTLPTINAVNYRNLAARIAKEENIPPELFKAIVRKESRFNPFAVYGGRKGYHFKNKSDAVRKVEQLKKAGKRNINVGLVQVNLQHHKSYSPEQLFDPECNLRYGARYLKKLHRQFGSWRKAVGFFHAGKNQKYYNCYIRNLSCVIPD